MNQFLSRRAFILIPTMSFLKIIFNPMKVLASSLPSKEEWNLSKDEWKARLSPESYYILREEGTERAFSSQLNNEKRKGIFHCAGCDLPLFSSDKKFDSCLSRLEELEFILLSISLNLSKFFEILV